jgi:uncharacterized membrane protein YhaH (DUF805 family)
MQWYFKVLENYVNFKGRARRKEYWMFFLVNTIISMVIGGVVGFTHFPLYIVNLYSLAVLLPHLAVSVRRLHDIDHNGWWVLVPFYNLYLACLAGDEQVNRYGPNPIAAESRAEPS